MTSTRWTAWASATSRSGTASGSSTKEDPAAGPVALSVAVGGADRGAGVLTMTGSSLTGVDTAVQGATVDDTGRLDPGRPARAQIRNGTCR